MTTYFVPRDILRLLLTKYLDKQSILRCIRASKRFHGLISVDKYLEENFLKSIRYQVVRSIIKSKQDMYISAGLANGELETCNYGCCIVPKGVNSNRLQRINGRLIHMMRDSNDLRNWIPVPSTFDTIISIIPDCRHCDLQKLLDSPHNALANPELLHDDKTACLLQPFVQCCDDIPEPYKSSYKGWQYAQNIWRNGPGPYPKFDDDETFHVCYFTGYRKEVEYHRETCKRKCKSCGVRVLLKNMSNHRCDYICVIN